jgi:translation initiation factor IF-1
MASKLQEIADRLEAGEVVKTRLPGNSMSGRIESGDLVTIEPVSIDLCKVGDAVYCKVNGRYMLHLVKAKGQDGRLQIGNNHGHVNGWTKTVYGKCVKVEP